MNMQAVLIATLAGTVAQVAMVVAGHYSPGVAKFFAVGGMGLSLLAGLLYAALSHGGLVEGAFHGAVAGGVCALIGIGVSRALGDVPTSLLLLGTISSIVTGAIGGAIGRLVF